MLVSVAATETKVTLVDTQGALADNDWANELHPYPGGFAKLANKFLEDLRKTFPGRI
jgi:hypothetical protein